MAKRGLGKGLDALFISEDTAVKEEKDAIVSLRITEVEPNLAQPRKAFDEEQLKELAASVKEHGIIQPIVVMKNEKGFYTIIAGERRWRAARMANLKEIPVIIREFDEKTASEVALIENLQRENLNPMEEADGFRNLMDTYGMTQEEVSEKIGKSRSAVANALRLLALKEPVRQLVRDGNYRRDMPVHSFPHRMPTSLCSLSALSMKGFPSENWKELLHSADLQRKRL